MTFFMTFPLLANGCLFDLLRDILSEFHACEEWRPYTFQSSLGQLLRLCPFHIGCRKDRSDELPSIAARACINGKLPELLEPPLVRLQEPRLSRIRHGFSAEMHTFAFLCAAAISAFLMSFPLHITHPYTAGSKETR